MTPQPSQAAFDLIRRFEGLRLTAYRDTGGLWTIGYGHLLCQATATGKETISAEDAEILFEADVDHHAEWILKLVHVPLTQSELDSLTSLVFNIGVEDFAGSTMHRLLNLGQMTAAADEFERWTHVKKAVVPGLVKRRYAEKCLFLTPSPFLTETLPTEPSAA